MRFVIGQQQNQTRIGKAFASSNTRTASATTFGTIGNSFIGAENKSSSVEPAPSKDKRNEK